MKILILANSVIGLYRFRREIIFKFLEKGFEVVVVSPNDDPDNYIKDLEENGVEYLENKIDRRGINPLKDLKLFIDYLKIIKTQNPDYILTYTIKPNIYGSLAANLLNKKYINNVTGLGTSLQKNDLLSKVLKQMYKVAFSRSKCIFFQNKTNLNFFINNKLLNKNNTEIKLIPGSGVNLNEFYPKEKVIEDNKIKFLFIGRIMDEKGITEYLECAKKLKSQKLNIEFQILGSFEEEKYKMIVGELEKKGIVKYLGVSSDIREQVAEVDCIINPSWHEGMSNILLEAGAMKKFLIASDIPGCKEIVINNKTGLSFEVKNSKELEYKILEYLSKTKEEKDKIINKLYTHIKINFDRKKIIQVYLNEIKKGSRR